MIFDKSILSISHKLEDAEPTGTLYSYSGTQNEQKNTHNNMIELEVRTLSTYVYIVPSHVNLVSKNFVNYV